MLFDEVTSALDGIMQRSAECHSSIRRTTKLTMMVTHQMGFVKEFARSSLFLPWQYSGTGERRMTYSNRPQSERLQQFLNE